jgi:glycosyltransferase involved in cell wall biosynthesis
MNIFIIPSWYPSESNPLEGIFVKEQVDAIAEYFPNHKVIISSWGHADSLISLRRPWKIFKILFWRLNQTRNQIIRKHHTWEIFNATIHSSPRLSSISINRLIEVNRRNLRLAIDSFGKVDLIHAHVSFPAGYISSILSNEFKIPFVLTEHMGPFPFLPFLKNGKPLEEISQAFLKSSKNIAVSKALRDQITSFGYPKPAVIPNMVDENSFFVSDPISNKFIFFTLCNIVEQKGIDHLLEAIALWNPSAEHFEFRIGGSGPLQAKYKILADRLNISDRVKWLGSVSRKQAPKLFQECNIFILPSLHETFGIVYAEAIASGKPIIATRCGGPEDIINNDNGLLVEVGDIKGLAKAMKQMAANWASYDVAKIRANFEQRFSRRAVSEQIIKIYQDVLKKPNF